MSIEIEIHSKSIYWFAHICWVETLEETLKRKMFIKNIESYLLRTVFILKVQSSKLKKHW